MRAAAVVLHRWGGLLIAAFLILAGFTGAVISWDHELDDLLNPHLMQTDTVGPRQDPLELARAIEHRYPEVRVSFVPLAPKNSGASLAFGIVPRVDPNTGELHEPGFNQVFVDPVSGRVLGTREWGAVWPISRETLVSFLYVLHYSLHLPEAFGTDRWGVWLMGGIAVLWMADCFVGAYLTLPLRRRAPASGRADAGRWAARWAPAWKIRFGAGACKLNFDLHRAAGLWAWALLFVIAFTAFSLNLYRELFLPVMAQVSQVTPSPFDLRAPRPETHPVEPAFGYARALALGQAERERRGWRDPPGSLFYSPDFGIYGIAFFAPGEGHGAGGAGHRELYFDARDGRLLGARQPWRGTAADLFIQAQFPLHSGRIFGLPGRILVSFMGLVVVLLSVTGIVIWWRKFKARSARCRLAARPPQ